MKIKKFDGLLLSETKKIESFANKKNNATNCTITAYSFSETDDYFWNVTCEICKGIDGERVDDVVLCLCRFDRRRSFIVDSDLLDKKFKKHRRTA